MSISEQISQLKTDFDDVHTAGLEAGKQAQNESMWKAITNDGTKSECRYAFYGDNWTDDNFKPTSKIYPYNFNYGLAKTKIEYGAYTDMLDFSRCAALLGAFTESTVKKLKVIDARNTTAGQNGMANMFLNCNNLESIDEFYPSTGTNTAGFSNTFNGCTSLTRVIFMSEIAQNGLDLSPCPLDHESIMSVINNLKDYTGTGTTRTVKLGATNLAKLTDVEKAIATEKGWTLA